MFKKDFNILIIGQIISVITSASLSFVLGLYILDMSKSATLFGIVTAISIIPWAIFGPLGGIIADKYNQKNIMVLLDFITGILLILCMTIKIDVMVVIVLKVIFSSVQALYYPSVVSAIPLIVDRKAIPRATSLVSQVNSVSRIISPMISGIIYSMFEIHYILTYCGVLFVISSLLEYMMNIKKAESKTQETTTLRDTIIFLKNEKLTQVIFISSIIVSAITAINAVGIPYIINITLELPSVYYGIMSASIGLGSFIAGIIIYMFHRYFTIRKIGVLYLGIIILLMISSVVLTIGQIHILFVLLTICFFLINVFMGIVYIIKNISIQKVTPQFMLGKVMSLFTICLGFFEPIFQLLYGFLFEGIKSSLIFMVISLCSIPIAYIIQKKADKLI